ncbi:hypothetical protein [Carboxylicivirga taeanensis]|uniref:hypothetical protein n=1 Tax=Carboxylicivirga taeanensis TaxID=1416875 RepID=UPI003F6DF99C
MCPPVWLNRMWDVARDAAELDAEITGSEDGLKIYFPLNKVAGVKFDDVTGNYKGEMRGNHGINNST